MNSKQTTALIIAAVVIILLAAAIGVFAFQMGQEQASLAGSANLTRTAVAVAPTRTPLPPPPIVTNTPTSTPTAIPTNTTTPTPTLTPTPSPTPTPTPIVVITHINSLGRLETTEFAMRTVIDMENAPDNLWQEIFGNDKLMLVAEGEVVAGFDLDKVEEENITVQGTQVTIVLPAPEILYSRIDNEKTYVYERKTGLFVEPDQSMEGRARQLAEEALLDWAIQRDIYAEAEKAGRLQIENLLRSLGFTDIEIIVKEKNL